MSPTSGERTLRAERLRAAAEAQLASALQTDSRPSAALLYELQIHQIELEMQNEALRQARTELEESRDRYVDLYDFAPVGYLTINANGMIEELNLTAAAMLGKERKNLLHRRFTALVVAEDQPRWMQLFLRVKEQDVKQSVELAMQRGDGTALAVQLDAHYRHLDTGETGLRVSLTDIAERKQAEQALRQATLQWQTTFDATQDAICLLDSEQKILRANSAMAALTGLALDDIVGRNCCVVVHSTPGAIADCPLRRARTSLCREQLVLQVGERWLQITVDPVLGAKREFLGAVHIMRDITEAKQLEDRVRQLAFHDTLTQLPNRRLLVDRLSQAMSASKRSGNYGALMMLDLDNFKTSNDTQGHQAGDVLLIEVARRLIECVRGADTVARIGGDEFVVMLGELNADKVESAKQAAEVAEKIRASLALSYRITLNEDEQAATTVEHHCWASIGVALFRNHEASQADLLKSADAAMYRAKEAGGNAVSFS